MTREETLAWAKSLKPGDKVIYTEGWQYSRLYVLEVVKVTPAGWVKTTDGKTFSQTSWRDSMYGRGDVYGKIIPVTEELLEKAKQQGEKRAEQERQRKILIKAQNKLYDESRKSGNLTYERAVKILEAFEQIDKTEDDT